MRVYLTPRAALSAAAARRATAAAAGSYLAPDKAKKFNEAHGIFFRAAFPAIYRRVYWRPQ